MLHLPLLVLVVVLVLVVGVVVIQKNPLNNGLSYVGHSNLLSNQIKTIYKVNNNNAIAVSDALITVTGNNYNDADNQGNFSIVSNTTKIVNSTYNNYYQFLNDSANLLTMNWKANTANTASTYDSQITATGSTTTTGDGNGTLNIMVFNGDIYGYVLSP